MLDGKRIAVVLPAYNAAATLERTYSEIPPHIVDDAILVDDVSSDFTAELASRIGIGTVIRHAQNHGYGGNQKTCYDAALRLGADIVIMLHPDYQYTPKLIPAIASIIASGLYQVVLGSRILGNGALRGGMPRYKYAANRALTFTQNLFMRQKLSEYHTGYRAFAREVLTRVNYHANSDDFVFDNEMIAQIVHLGYDIAEVTCPTKYCEEASSIDLRRSIVYGLGVLRVTAEYMLQQTRIVRFEKFRDLGPQAYVR